MDINAENDSDLFNAARVSLGALGIVTSMKLQNRTPYRLKAVNGCEPIEQALEHFDESAQSHRHYEMFPLTHSDYALTLAIDETDEPINNPSVSRGSGIVCQRNVGLVKRFAGLRKPLVDGVAAMMGRVRRSMYPTKY